MPPPRAAAAAEAAPAPSSSSDEGPRIVWSATKGSPRATRLEVFVQLRKLYRNLLRAEAVLEAPSPVYQPVPKPGALVCTVGVCVWVLRWRAVVGGGGVRQQDARCCAVGVAG